jgi:hypothetical protein
MRCAYSYPLCLAAAADYYCYQVMTLVNIL